MIEFEGQVTVEVVVMKGDEPVDNLNVSCTYTDSSGICNVYTDNGNEMFHTDARILTHKRFRAWKKGDRELKLRNVTYIAEMNQLILEVEA